MLAIENDLFTPIISRYLHIEDKTWGDDKKGYVIRFSGQLYNQDSAQAYDQLAEVLRPQNITPIFRLESGKHIILLQNGIIQPKPTRIWANILFFILTLISVTFTGAVFSSGDIPSSISGWYNFMRGGLPFSIALLTILLFHEFGHYLVGRYHKTAVTLPFFIPLPYPISFFGTFGAFIQMKEPPKNRRTLLDIGIAGPLSGLIVAIPILLYGLYLSPVGRLPVQFPAGQILEGNSILYLLLKFIAKGQFLPQPFTYAGISPILYWIRYFFTSTPLPAGGLDVNLHPIAWAGWIGLLVTSLNLIPAGPLDGGHIMYVLLGKRANKLLPFILLALVALCFVTISWLFPILLIFLVGRVHVQPLDEITPLDSKRRALAVLGLIVFILVFIPVPLI